MAVRLIGEHPVIQPSVIQPSVIEPSVIEPGAVEPVSLVSPVGHVARLPSSDTQGNRISGH
ncbi:hypothetical protein [Microbispora bryophytorum]|uniref:hypothetical protein n=1 Tax=Microbispora bryophytorum TaxID=1460882 RepID=UPI00340B912A